MRENEPLQGGRLKTLQSLSASLSDWGEKTAVEVFARDESERCSYAELSNYAERFARCLIARGLRPAEAVGIVAGPSIPWIASCIGIIRAGAIVVPIDTQLTDEVLKHVVQDSAARFIVTTSQMAARVSHIGAVSESNLILLDGDHSEPRHWLAADHDDTVLLSGVAEGDVAALFYTSGTTGLPKGVELTHANFTYQLQTIIDARIITHQTRVLLPLPLHHVYPFVLGMLAPLALGRCIVLPQALTGPQITRVMREGAIEVFVGVPRLYEVLYAGIRSSARERGRLRYAFFSMCFRFSLWLRRRWGIRAGSVLLRPMHKKLAPRLDLVASGGAALDEGLAWNLEALGWRLAEGYGLTETSPLLTLNVPGRAQIGSVGFPIPGMELRVDSAGDQREGEICARGPGIFKQYRNLPEKTREAFTEDGWFRTGDIGYLDDSGFLHVTGRVSTMIVTPGGENVQPEDVERAYERRAVIKEIGVFQKAGRLVAVVLPEATAIQELGYADVDTGVREAIQEQSQNLASYQLLSDYVITREALARTRLGKIQRHMLEAHYDRAEKLEQAAGLEVLGPMALEEMSDRDRELLEVDAAARVWELLAERYEGMRLTPDTYVRLELGVDSLEWVDLALNIYRASGAELGEARIARIETVRDLLAAVSESATTIEDRRIPWILEDPEAALSEEQRRWLAPLSPAMKALSYGLYQLNRLLMRRCFRLRVRGVDGLPEKGPLIIAPNHSSYLDPFVIAAALSFEQLTHCNWAALRAVVYANPIARLGCRLAQAVPVDPREAVLSSLAFGAAVLRRERNLIWFPEGRRSTTGELLPFRPGISELVLHFQVPVIPAFIHGTFQALPPGSKRLRLKPIDVVFGKPLAAGELDRAGAGDDPRTRITSALYEKVLELSHQLDASDDENNSKTG